MYCYNYVLLQKYAEDQYKLENENEKLKTEIELLKQTPKVV